MRLKLNLAFTAALSFLSIIGAFGQYVNHVKSGTIIYERRTNVYAILPKVLLGPQAQQRAADYKSSRPQFLHTTSTLTFSGGKTIFVPNDTRVDGDLANLPFIAQSSVVVFQNLRQDSLTAEKDVYGKKFLVRDKLPYIKWKITDETREIAGYECRRANGIIMDSIYVVAFYASRIPVPSGPESFHGLPGMILQVALPRENVSWIALSVTHVNVLPPKAPSGPKPSSFEQLKTELTESLQRFGQQAITYLKAYLL